MPASGPMADAAGMINTNRTARRLVAVAATALTALTLAAGPADAADATNHSTFRKAGENQKDF